MSLDDIWATLEQNINNSAAKVINKNEKTITAKNQNTTNYENSTLINENKKSSNIQKISTGCGPSPPKEIKHYQNKKTSESISTGTSPPPQSISTQVSLTLFIPFYFFLLLVF